MQVEITTSVGQIILELFPDKAPKTVENFLGYVRSGFYTNLTFHRVMNRFMIQGGGFTLALKQKVAGEPIVNESSNGLSNERYTLAMARTADPDSATSQFYINTANNDFLDFRAGPGAYRAGYAVFGKVVQGFDVVDKIEQVKTHRVGVHEAVPVSPILILGAHEILEQGT